MSDSPEAQRVKAVQGAIQAARDSHAATLQSTPLLPQFSTRPDGVVVDSRSRVVYTPPTVPVFGKKQEG